MIAVWSLNEIEALARKATRGAGYDWGMAEESGQAVRWLLARGLPGADALLSACRIGAATASDSCPLTLGCRLSDGITVAPETSDVISPLLVLPFVAWTAGRQNTTLCLRWPGAVFSVTPKGNLALRGGSLLPESAEISVDSDVPDGLVAASVGYRAEVSCETFLALSQYAAKTYAPATEESRESGAGAGLTDND